MGRIDKFLARPVEVEIGGEKVMLKPFTVKELPLLTKLESKNEEIRSKAIQEIIKLTMKQIDPSATDEQIENVSVKYLEEIMDAVAKVNNIDMDEAKKQLLNRQ